MKKKILIDLDVVTVAEWDGKGIEFINRVKSGEFEVSTPYVIFDLVSEWRNKELGKRITEFYELYSNNIITVQDLFSKIKELNFDNNALTRVLMNNGVKGEDAILTVIVSIFNLDYLVTYNRKHLKNKKDVINNVLSKYGIRTIKIVLPSEI